MFEKKACNFLALQNEGLRLIKDSFNARIKDYNPQDLATESAVVPIQTKIEFEENPEKELAWDLGPTCLAELSVGFHRVKAFGEKVSRAQIDRFLEQKFGVELKATNQLLSNIKQRTGESAVFLTQLRDAVNSYVDESLEIKKKRY